MEQGQKNVGLVCSHLHWCLIYEMINWILLGKSSSCCYFLIYFVRTQNREITIVYHFFQVTLGWEAASGEQNRLLGFFLSKTTQS